MIKRKISLLKAPLVIFICGMPGTRKSSTAVQLASKLGIKVAIGTDQIRDIVKSYSPFEDPFLQRPTHTCWELIGNKTPENIARGYWKQSVLVKKAVLAVLRLAEERGENIIVEGVHLAPALYAEQKNNPNLTFFHFLLWTGDEKLHLKNIAQKIHLRHGKEENWPKEKIEEIREIQKFLISQANCGVYLINSTSPEENVKTILKILGESL